MTHSIRNLSRLLVSASLALGLTACDSGGDEETTSKGSDSGKGTGGNGTDGDTGSDTGGGPRTEPPKCSRALRMPDAPMATYTGDLVIEGADPDKVLDKAASYDWINGQLVINRTELTNLDKLACLQGVNGQVNIFENEKLADLWGLANLSVTNDALVVSKNTVLEDLHGLEKVTSVTNLQVTDNPALKSLKGLDNLVTIKKSLVIRYNDSLADISALIGLQTVGDNYNFVHNKNVCVSHILSVGTKLTKPPKTESHDANKEGC